MPLRLEGCEYDVDMHNIVLERRGAPPISGMGGYYEAVVFVQKNTQKGRVPTLMRDGSVVGVKGVKRWWVLAPITKSDTTHRMRLHPDKIADVYSRMVLLEARAATRLQKIYSEASGNLREELSNEGVLLLDAEFEVLNARMAYGEISYTLCGGPTTANTFSGTPLKKVRRSSAIHFRSSHALIDVLVYKRRDLCTSIIETAGLYATIAAAAPKEHDSTLLLTTRGTPRGVSFHVDVTYGCRTKLTWSAYREQRRGAESQYTSLQIVENPQCRLEWFVCQLPYGYREENNA